LCLVIEHVRSAGVHVKPDVPVQVREKLERLDKNYFLKLADAMESWIDAWEQLNPPQASAASSEPKMKPAEHALPNGNPT